MRHDQLNQRGLALEAESLDLGEIGTLNRFNELGSVGHFELRHLFQGRLSEINRPSIDHLRFFCMNRPYFSDALNVHRSASRLLEGVRIFDP